MRCVRWRSDVFLRIIYTEKVRAYCLKKGSYLSWVRVIRTCSVYFSRILIQYSMPK